MTRLIYRQRAREDLNEILDHIAEHAPGAAVRSVASLMATCELLATQPNIGVLVENISPGLRRITHRSYVIFYRHDSTEDVVRIVRVLHHARDVGRASFE